MVGAEDYGRWVVSGKLVCLWPDAEIREAAESARDNTHDYGLGPDLAAMADEVLRLRNLLRGLCDVVSFSVASGDSFTAASSATAVRQQVPE